jgi:hypothetical protein
VVASATVTKDAQAVVWSTANAGEAAAGSGMGGGMGGGPMGGGRPGDN